MARGIDVYQKYQTVSDWAKVKGSGVTFVYVKGTDGGGLASVHADAYVKGSKGVELPTGLYHYAELTPSPETQADVLTAEVNRLGAYGLPPALDLEAPFVPGSSARSFAQRFLNRLRANGFPVVTLYANTSMLAGINADTLGVPGVKIWAANYGVNDGIRHSYSYPGHVDVHQYTSNGRVPGITGLVDMNESLTDISNNPTEDDVSWTEQLEDWDPPNTTAAAKVWLIASRKAAGDAADGVAQLRAQVAALTSAVTNGAVGKDEVLAAVKDATKETIGTVVLPALREVVTDALGADNTAQADAIVTAMAERLGHSA